MSERSCHINKEANKELPWDSVEKQDITGSHEQRGKEIAGRRVPGQRTGVRGVLGNWRRLAGKGRGGF